jgi:hypothetical protein
MELSSLRNKGGAEGTPIQIGKSELETPSTKQLENPRT